MPTRSSTALRARGRAPRLVLRFTLLTALGLTIAAAVVVTVVRDAYAVQGQQRAIDRARLAAQAVLERELRPTDLMRPVRASRQRQLKRLFARLAIDDTWHGVTLYSRRGVITFSTSQNAAGRANVEIAREAATSSSLIARISRGTSGRTLTAYVPIVVGARSAGVVALASDYEPIAAAARRSTLLIAGVLEGVLLVLVLVLTPTFVRASRRIGEQVDVLDHLVTHDELTGLPNRTGFLRALERETVTGTGATVMLVDLDGFHDINDALGPERGDVLLREVSDRLRSFPGALTVARLGEDEFGFLLSTADAVAIAAAEGEIHSLLARPLRVGEQQVAVDATIGCSVFPIHGSDPLVLLRRAGVALSLAKERRLGFERYDPYDDHGDVARLALAAELRDALADGQLTVYYQPQADLSTGAVRGAEALVRWQHPTRGLLSAAEFISLAERTGLSGELKRFVLSTAARQWHDWNGQGLTVDIAVNLAAIDLLDPRLPEEVEALIQRHALPAEYLVLEITERTTLGDEPRVRDALERLTGLGARLAIDDYGTGYSSLAHLRNLHARQIKLDKTFMADIPGDAANEAILRSTIELAHSLGATVVAEGVETHAQWRHLVSLGCDIAQGYLIGRPIAADEFLESFVAPPALRGVA
jgi:diguanylate cyclase (GGDEF)-like protein